MTVVLLPITQILNGFLYLSAQRQGMGLPPGVVQLIENAQCFPPLLLLHFVFQPIVIDLVSVPGLAQAVAELCSQSLALLFKGLEGGEGLVEISRSELIQCSFAQCLAPLEQSGAVIAFLLCTAHIRIHKLCLQVECLAAVARLPGQFSLATTADGLFAGCFSVEPAKCRQLFAVAQAGLKISL